MTLTDATSTDPIVLRVEGDLHELDAAVALDLLRGLLDVVTDDGTRTTWHPVDVHPGSLVMTVLPKTDAAGTATSLARARKRMRSIEDLREGRPGAEQLSLKTIRKLVQLGNKITAANGVEGLSLSQGDDVTARVDAATITHGEALIEGTHESVGSVTGRLDLISARRGRRHVEVSTSEDGVVKCDVPAALWRRTLDLMDQDVVVDGVLHRNAFGTRTRIEALRIDPVPPRPLPPTVEELTGILEPDWTGGLDSVEWVRQQRD